MNKHEQAVLVVLSYIIGFTTAFLMFGLTGGEKDGKQEQVQAVTAAQDDQAYVSVEILETAEGLFLKKNGQERILSASTDSEIVEAGFHLGIAIASVSPDGNYVYYCAKMEAGLETCRHFVYSVSEDKTYMIKDGDDGLQTSVSEASEITWSGNSDLIIGGRLASQDTLWTLE